MKILDYLCNCKSEISNVCNAVEGHCVQATKIVRHYANGRLDWLISGHQSVNPWREAISILSGKYKRLTFVHPVPLMFFIFAKELTLLVPIGRIKGALHFNSYSLGSYFSQSNYNLVVDRKNTPVEDLIRSQLQSEEEFIRPRFFSFQTVYSRKFQIIVDKNLPQALACRLAQFVQVSEPKKWLILGVSLTHLVERRYLFFREAEISDNIFQWDELKNMRQIKSYDDMFQAIRALIVRKFLKIRILSQKFLQNKSFLHFLSNALIFIVVHEKMQPYASPGIICTAANTLF